MSHIYVYSCQTVALCLS